MRCARIITLFFILFLKGHLLFAQVPWIVGEISDFSKSDYSDKVYLLRTVPLKATELLDSVKVNQQGEFRFIEATYPQPHLYHIQFKKGSPVVFLSVHGDKIRLTANASDFFYGKAQIAGSIENRLFQQLEQMKERNGIAQKKSGKAYDEITYFDHKYNTKTAAIRSEFDSVLQQSNKEIMQLRTNHAGTFAADVLSGLYYHPFKEDSVVTDSLFDNNLAFQHNHFFDGIMLNELDLASFDVYYDRIDEYMGSYVETGSVDGLKTGVENLMNRISNQEVRSTLALYLSNRFRKMKQHEMTEYILDTYYAEGCAIAVNNNWSEMVANLRAASIGSIAPELSLPNLEGVNVKLSSTRGKKAVIIYFWSSRCQYCTEAMPELITFYNDHAPLGLEIYGASLDDGRQAWKNYSSTIAIPWINVCDGQGTGGKNALTYTLRGTPTYLLLDADMRITLRTHDLHELMTKVIELL